METHDTFLKSDKHQEATKRQVMIWHCQGDFNFVHDTWAEEPGKTFSRNTGVPFK